MDKRQLIDKADRVISKFVRERDEGICPICHKREVEVCFHMISRTKFGTRWDVQNCFGSCWICNDTHERDEAPGREYFMQAFGQDLLDELFKKSNRTEPFSRQELERIIKYYSL